MESQLTMGTEVQQLISLITKMQDRQEAAQQQTNDHLVKLRENVHSIKNEYHGVNTLTHMIRNDVNDFKAAHEKDHDGTHARISEQEKKFEAKLSATDGRISNIEEKIAVMSPKTESFGKIRDNVSKSVTGALVATVFTAMAFLYNKGP